MIRRALMAGAASLMLAVSLVAVTSAPAAADPPIVPPTDGPPMTPPAPICGDTALLSGPAVQPPGSVRVDPGQNLNDATINNPAGTTFWLSPGTHIFADGPFGQTIPKSNNTYIGAPGAIIDGRHENRYAFTQPASGVTLRYLTIQNFVSPNAESIVNHDGGDGWTIEYTTIKDNKAAGLELGSNTVVRYNCITNNGQYGFNVSKPQGVHDILLDHNEIGYNAADDIETSDPACGCSGGGKFWGVHGAIVTNNWVHHNKAQGLFADTNAVGFRIEGNYINDNTSEGIVYETSYNAYIHNNTLIRNGLRKGAIFAARNDGFPIAAIYIQESGGDSRVFGGVYSTLEISGNYLDNNWGGVVLWENANRFCNTAGSTADGYCPIAGQGTVATCVSPTINNEPYYSDCRWKTQNVLVTDNEFRINKATVPCSNNCGIQGLFSVPGNSPPWSPYQGNVIQEGITFHQNNHFTNNRYFGDWRYDAYSIGAVIGFGEWQSAPYLQDIGSTLVNPGHNSLPGDTSTIEGSTGAWVPWFSSATSRTTTQAHGGVASLKVDITAPFWGVTQNNFPGFSAYPGSKIIGFWGKAGVGTDLAATMTVRWRNASGAEIGTSQVTLPLGASWAEAKVQVVAPPGTAKLGVDFSNAAGVGGNSLYLDDIVVLDAPQPVNILNGVNSDLETGLGVWVPWFSSAVAQSGAQAHSGTKSLEVTVTAPFGWGVTQSNWPGFATAPGTKSISFWGKAPTGSGLAATMHVTFRNEAGATLGTAEVAQALGNSWTKASAVVVAPAGTTRVGVDFSNSAGVGGNKIYLDDIVVIDSDAAPPPPPPPNLLDANTASIEGSAGKWVPWFSSAVSRSTDQAHGGTASLKVDITAAFGWGVTQSNWPGFAATPGNKHLSFWGIAPSGSGLSATMYVTWRDAGGTTLQTDVLTLPLGASWAEASANILAPAGTAKVGVDVTNSSGGAGNTVYLDDFTVVDV